MNTVPGKLRNTYEKERAYTQMATQANKRKRETRSSEVEAVESIQTTEDEYTPVGILTPKTYVHMFPPAFRKIYGTKHAMLQRIAQLKSRYDTKHRTSYTSSVDPIVR